MHSLRVLLVDDNALVRAAMSRALRSLGCFVVVLETFLDALEALDSRSFEIVIADYHLGPAAGEDGLTVLERARDRQPGSLRVLCTGAPPAQVDAAVRSGLVQTLLLKPVEVAALEAVLARVRGA